jgi:tetratricopeptide (TPR) repeat protein
LLFLLVISAPETMAKSVVPPRDPTQSITYWKSQVIDPAQNADIAMAHSVFDVLLRSWDAARVEPNLYVVNSSSGPWAASLADGNILLSSSAIDVCLQYGKQYAEHLLAFILGHELAHQRAEDLWHQKFLRLAGSQAPEIQAQLLKDLKINPDSIAQLEQREAQADHDGLLIMASVGYNPFKVVDHKDFFTTWVENLWQVSCSDKQLDSSIVNACKKAQTRALRTRTQLTTVATQNTLFELGIQAYVAGNYTQAQHFFSAFGKDYPNRSVFANIGLTYLQQAIEIEDQIAELDTSRAKFIYPAILSSSPLTGAKTTMASNNKRGAIDVLIAQLNAKKHQLVETAIPQFEKAIRLQPQHRLSYILLASSYLVDDNLFMTRGILQGKYLPLFGEDAATHNLLAITSFKEKHVDDAVHQFQTALQITHSNKNHLMEPDTTRYIITSNLASALKQQGKMNEVKIAWNSLASYAKQQGNGYLFQMAVYHVNSNAINTSVNRNLATVSELSAGKNKASAMHKVNELWLDGSKYLVMRNDNGDRKITDDENHVIATSNVTPLHEASKTIVVDDSADRPLKLFGMPSRRIQLTSGEYLAYDTMSLALHIVNNRVVDWFTYAAIRQ